MKEFVNNLFEDFADKEYAHSYMESHSVSRLAAQINALRKKCGWSQQQLAEHAGLAQERVSKIESADFDSLTIKTLRKFSRAFDVNLRIAFEPFSEGIMDVVNLTRDRLAVETRTNDLTRFRNSSLLLDGDGSWRAVVRPRLQVLTGTVSGSITPSRDWQKIKTLENSGLPKLEKVA